MPILTPEELCGQRLADRYRLEAILSAGGMGVLFQALDETTGRDVAVKILKPAYSLEPDRVARFLRETRIASSLQHPNIAAVLDARSDETGFPFMVMELLEGASLEQALEERGVLPLAETLAIAVPIAGALAAAHAMGVIHRDIKPGNIFLCRDAQGAVVPKLLDFGIAKSPKDEFETQTGLIIGTPGYMAPEQVQHGECGPFTDIWGVGAVLYRCLTGRPPHTGNSVREVLGKLLREPVAPLVLPGVGGAACATIDRALAQDPYRRYPSMEAFRRALASAAGALGRDETMNATASVEAVTRDVPGIAPPPTGDPVTSRVQAREAKAGRFAPSVRELAALCMPLLGVVALLCSHRTESARTDAKTESPALRAAEQSSFEAPAGQESTQWPAQTPVAVLNLAPGPALSALPPRSEARGGKSAKPSPVHRKHPALAVTSETPRKAPAEREESSGIPVATEW